MYAHFAFRALCSGSSGCLVLPKKLAVLFETGYKCHEFGQKLNEEAELARNGGQILNQHTKISVINLDCLIVQRI